MFSRTWLVRVCLSSFDCFPIVTIKAQTSPQIMETPTTEDWNEKRIRLLKWVINPIQLISQINLLGSIIQSSLWFDLIWFDLIWFDTRHSTLNTRLLDGPNQIVISNKNKTNKKRLCLILLLQRCRRILFQIGIKNLRKPTTMEEHNRNHRHYHYHRRRHGYQDPSIPINLKFVSKHIHLVSFLCVWWNKTKDITVHLSNCTIMMLHFSFLTIILLIWSVLLC